MKGDSGSHWARSITIGFTLGLVCVLAASQVRAVSASSDEAQDELAALDAPPGLRPANTPPPAFPVPAATNAGFLQWPRLTGDWGGWRTNLEAHGVTFAGQFTADTSAIWSGRSSEITVARSLLDLNVTCDLDPLLGLKGGTFFAQYFNREGANGSHRSCDLQGFDNIDGRPFSQAEEIWFEQKFSQGHLRAKVGQVDANAEFDHLDAASDFINSSAGFSPTLLSFPTYPNPAMSLNLFAYPVDWFYCGAGAYTFNLRRFSSDRLDHPFVIGEAGFNWKKLGRLGPGRVGAGCWRNMGWVSCFDGNQSDRASGVYALAQQQIWAPHADDKDNNEAINIFFQYGYAGAEVSAFEHQIGLGLSADGLIPHRSQDAAGLYWSWTDLSGSPGAGFTRNESALEAFYKVQLTPFFSLKPDLQWIQNPGGQPLPGAAWIATLRLQVQL